ncbi:MAG: hypothetical protein KDD83_30440, partial [Caldilineaceae bacterium]|nr:hypothetical protein [Caldilineaceae bacterium]
YGSRLSVAEHGFETVTVGLMENAEYFRQVLGRHNIELRTDLVERELDSIRASGESPEVVQQVIEGHSDAATRQSTRPHPEQSLDRLQANIEMV